MKVASRWVGFAVLLGSFSTGHAAAGPFALEPFSFRVRLTPEMVDLHPRVPAILDLSCYRRDIRSRWNRRLPDVTTQTLFAARVTLELESLELEVGTQERWATLRLPKPIELASLKPSDLCNLSLELVPLVQDVAENVRLTPYRAGMPAPVRIAFHGGDAAFMVDRALQAVTPSAARCGFRDYLDGLRLRGDYRLNSEGPCSRDEGAVTCSGRFLIGAVASRVAQACQEERAGSDWSSAGGTFPVHGVGKDFAPAGSFWLSWRP